MFWAPSCPSSGATTTAVAISGLPLELGDSSAVGRPTALLSTSSDGKPEAATAVVDRLLMLGMRMPEAC